MKLRKIEKSVDLIGGVTITYSISKQYNNFTGQQDSVTVTLKMYYPQTEDCAYIETLLRVNNILTTYSTESEIKGKMVMTCWDNDGKRIGCWQNFYAKTYNLAFQMAENYINELMGKLEGWLIEREAALKVEEEME